MIEFHSLNPPQPSFEKGGSSSLFKCEKNYLVRGGRLKKKVIDSVVKSPTVKWGFYLGNKISLLRKTQSDTVNSDESITAERLLNVLSQMPDDFYEEERTDEPPQEKEEL